MVALVVPCLAACAEGQSTPRPHLPSHPTPRASPDAAPAEPVAAAAGLFDDAVGFGKLPPSAPTGWRARFDEPGQTFVDYLATQPRRPAQSDALYLLPLGEMGTAFVVDHDYTYVVRTPAPEAIAELASTFFGVPTKVLDQVALESLVESQRVVSGHEQFRAQDVLRATRRLRPKNAYSMAAMVVRDVYFDEAQSYGFGFGQHRDGQAVVSFARLDPVVSGHARPDDILEILPGRAFKLVVHELGHTFGFEHCTEHRCVMNGFADLDELDATPLHLGPQCLRKLLFATRVEPLERYRRLAALYASLGLEERAWVDARLERMR